MTADSITIDQMTPDPMTIDPSTIDLNTVDLMTIDQWIVDAAQRTPDKTAIHYKEQIISYSQFAEKITSRADNLCTAGIQQGDRVVWYGLNNPEFFYLLFACARIGAILVPLNWRLAAPEINNILDNCEPKLVFHDDNYAEAALALANVVTVAHREQAPPQTGSETNASTTNAGKLEDPLLLVYTSGSTGTPKGVVLTQKALVCNAAMAVDAHKMTAADKVLAILPVFHVGGINIMPTPAFSLGASVELHERFDPDMACKALSNNTLTVTVPTAHQAMMASDKWSDINWTHMRGMSIGSTDVPVALIRAMQKLGIPLIQIYGATETSPFAIYQRLGESIDKVGSIGRAGSACDIRLVANNKDVGIGEPGEIWVKGDNVLREYWRNPELSNETLREGWWRTGDVATMDKSGLIWFTDRIKHVIISGGENIYPTEIERILNQIPAITEASVVGQADEKWGEIPVAVVVCKETMQADDVLNALKGKIANYKLPKKVVFVDALPRNATGKVVAAKVRELLNGL